MLNFFVVGVLTTGLVSGSIYTVWAKNNETAMKIKKSEELKVSKDRVSLLGRYSPTGKGSYGEVSKKVTLSSFIERDLSDNEENELNNFQKAVKKAIIENNISEPSCADLVNTGFISLLSCEKIKDKVNKFADIKDGEISVENSEIANIIENTDFYSQKKVHENGKITYKSFNNTNMNSNLVRLNKELKTNKYLNSSISNIKNQNELKVLGSTLIRNAIRSKDNSLITLSRIEKVFNRIEYLKFKDAVSAAKANGANQDTIKTLRVQYQNRVLRSESKFERNAAVVDSSYYLERLNTLKTKLNYKD